jgi:hypothetical protein
MGQKLDSNNCHSTVFYCKRFKYIYIEITKQVEIYQNIYMNNMDMKNFKKPIAKIDLAINELPLATRYEANNRII